MRNTTKLLILKLTLSLSCFPALSQTQEKQKRKPIFTLEQRQILMEAKKQIRESVLESGEELIVQLEENKLGKNRPKKIEIKNKVKALLKLSAEEKNQLISSISDLTEELKEAQSIDAKFLVLEKLIPKLKQIPPPPRNNRE